MKKVCYLSKVCRNEQKCLILFVENCLDFGKSLMLVVAEKSCTHSKLICKHSIGLAAEKAVKDNLSLLVGKLRVDDIHDRCQSFLFLVIVHNVSNVIGLFKQILLVGQNNMLVLMLNAVTVSRTEAFACPVNITGNVDTFFLSWCTSCVPPVWSQTIRRNY